MMIKVTRRIMSIIMVILIIAPMCVMSTSAFAIPYDRAGVKGYTTYSGRTYVYTNSSLTKSKGWEYIDGTDEVTIISFSTDNNSVYVRYPTYSGVKYRWASAYAFFPSGINRIRTCYTSRRIYTYKYYNSSSSSSYGYIGAGDIYYRLGTLGSKTRVIYPITGGGYKMAWINN